MADGVFVRGIQGIEDLQANIATLAKGLPPEKIEKLLRHGADIFAASIKAHAPYDEKRKKGTHLRDAVVVKRLRRRLPAEPAPYIATVDRKKAPHFHLVEMGTGERIAKKGKYAGRHFGAMPAHPMMRPAWEEDKEAVMAMILGALNAQVTLGVKPP